MATKTPDEIKEIARRLYLQQWTVAEIAIQIKRSARIIYKWIETEHWDDFCPVASVKIINARRLNTLALRENKTDKEIAEYEMLCRAYSKMQIDLATAEKIKAESEWIRKNGVISSASGKQPHDDKTRTDKKKKSIKNDVSSVTPEQLDSVFEKLFFGYQKVWHEAKQNELTRRIRFILKSRQIGATFYFAFEALDDAIRTGDNQIFLSASRDQAEIFKAYIIAFAKEHLDIELKGTGVILLSNGAELRFLSTNMATAQGYHGHLYIDEVLWIMNFTKVNKVASGIAAHKKWRKTYFSTPSTLNHEAWAVWTGKKYTDRKKIEGFNVSHSALQNGAKYADGIWRHIVTVEDAEKQGCDLFDIEQLRNEYSTAEFDNLFMCKPIDDSQSVFGLELLLSCMVDTEKWLDYKPDSARPFLNKAVSFGYDPAYTGDGAALAITDIPESMTKPFRLLAYHKFYGKNYTHQANRVKELTSAHNVIFFGADNTGGTGITMCEKIQEFYPMVTLYHYSPQIKGMLIGKMLDLMTNGRFQYLASNDNVTRAFLLIKQTITASGGATTYTTERVKADDTSSGNFSEHGDVAWAIMHAVQIEPVAERAPTTAFIN